MLEDCSKTCVTSRTVPASRRDADEGAPAHRIVSVAMEAGHARVLDGGMGHLIKTTFNIDSLGLPFAAQFAATNLACLKAPQVVISAHSAYVDAGCDVITTNNFVSTQYHFAKAKLDEDPDVVWQVITQSRLSISGPWRSCLLSRIQTSKETTHTGCPDLC